MQAIISLGADSSYYELALYKLGWTLYKQDFYDEALHQYMALLDYKVSIGYDFDQQHEEDDERRVADTFRVISLASRTSAARRSCASTSRRTAQRSYEDRIYANLGEFYLAKLRYDDAAKIVQVVRGALSVPPRLAALQHAGDRDLSREGNFPKLVLESKKDVRGATTGCRRSTGVTSTSTSRPRC